MIRLRDFLICSVLLVLVVLTSSVYGDVYKIKERDNLLIAVIGQPEYTQTVQVREDGRISYFGGDLEVAGKTTDEVNRLIYDFLQNEQLVNNPIIMVSPVLHETGVIVGGAVINPGRYPISPESSIDIYRAIALAGGFTENADRQQVQLIRYKPNVPQQHRSNEGIHKENGTSSDAANVETYNLSTNQPYREIRVAATDLVYVMPLSVIEVQGEVKTPGKLFVRDNVSITTALARAGGLTEEADLSSFVKVNKDGTHIVFSISEEYWQNAEENEKEISLTDGEVLFVPNAIKMEPIYVTGYVHEPGAQRVRGPLTINKAIALAGGFEDEANSKKLFIHRVDGTIIEHNYMVGIDTTILYPGDILEVKKRFQLNWGMVSTIVSTTIAVTYFIINLTQN